MSVKTERMVCAVLIPALNPEKGLIEYVRELIARKVPAVVVVNDGSSAEFTCIFDELAKIEKVTVLTHPENRGKGCALKTAFRYFIEDPSMQGIAGVVTADADGQHLVDDVMNVACLTQRASHKIIMGTRNLKLSHVPKRSKLGNRLTSFGFHALYGANLEDTQTGLRGFPRDLFDWCANVKGERFEYEMNVLIRAVREQIPFEETQIQTVYYNNNEGSHLRAFRDSWRIFLILISGLGMYTVAAALSAAIDVVMFWVSYRFIFARMPEAFCYLASTVLARILSSIVNFVLNRRYVFNSTNSSVNSAIRYYTLWLGQMLASYVGLLALQAILPAVPAVILKALIDVILAVLSYQIQLRWVFHNGVTAEQEE